MNVYDYINFRFFLIFQNPLISYMKKVQSLSKQTIADDGTDMNATKELCDPVRTTHERK